jgi:lysyl-tRNA synthetase class 2
MSGPEEKSPPADAPEVASESDLLRNRRENLRRVEALGLPSMPVRFPLTATVSEIVQRFEGRTGPELEASPETVTTAGRVLALRTAGKAGFLDPSDGRHRLQVYLRREAVGEAVFAMYQSLDLGDWVGAEGEIFRTRTGELSFKARSLTLLQKCLRPLPEKWHGLKDVERYRQRYLTRRQLNRARPGAARRSCGTAAP